VAREAAVRWAERHYDDDPIEAMRVVQEASLDLLDDVDHDFQSLISDQRQRLS